MCDNLPYFPVLCGCGMSVSEYSVKEKIANTISHGIGLILGLVGLVLLLVKR